VDNAGYAIDKLTKGRFYIKQGRKNKWGQIPIIDNKGKLSYFLPQRFINERFIDEDI